MCNPQTNTNTTSEKNASIENEKQLSITIDGVTYDITSFKHPGGSIIRYLAGDGQTKIVDATAAFNEFHYRNQSKVRQFLKSLPKLQAQKLPQHNLTSDAYQAVSLDFLKVSLLLLV